MSTVHRDRALALLDFSHGLTLGLLKDVPADKMTFQPTPTENHFVWTFGHLASTYSWLKSLVDGQMHPLPDSYNGLFGMGSKPTPDAKAYPSFAEVKKHNDEAYAAFVGAVKKQTDAELLQPTAADSHGFATDRLDAVAKGAWHEGWHAGQLANVRKALGIKNLWG